jgi:hypothetical protein
MIVETPKRILTGDFEEEDKALADRLGGILNSFLEQMHHLTQKSINIQDNLNQFVRSVTVTVDAAGVPTTTIGFQNTLKSRVSGTQVIRAFGDSGVVSQPFISYIESNGNITITQIVGLRPNVSYNLVVLVIGD